VRKELNELRLKKDPGHAAKKKEFDQLQKSIKEATQKALSILTA
jgi:hypothetical protein